MPAADVDQCNAITSALGTGRRANGPLLPTAHKMIAEDPTWKSSTVVGAGIAFSTACKAITLLAQRLSRHECRTPASQGRLPY